MKPFALLLVLFIVSIRCSAQTETPSIQVVNSAVENAINLAAIQSMPKDTLGLFLPMSDSAYCSMLDSLLPSRFGHYFGLAGLNNSKTIRTEKWHYKGKLLHACYLEDDLVSINYGDAVFLVEGSAMVYHFYLGKLIFTRNTCTAYIGAVCSGETSDVSYYWRNHSIVRISDSREATENQDRGYFIERCHCARQIPQEYWLEELTSILHYMQHVKPQKN